MIDKFFTNFWLWWYVVRSREEANNLFRSWLHFAAITNLSSMLTNLFVPLYQDYSSSGRIISFSIRFCWVIIAGFIQIVLTIPMIIYYVILFVLPIFSIVAAVSLVLPK